jgi:ABC-type nitrate/sulfonate/bicarbonate transport system permease component
VALLFWAAVWALASARVGKELILPSPLDVVRKLADSARPGPFWLRRTLSLFKCVFIGYTAGVAAGTILAFLPYSCRRPTSLLSPRRSRVVRATPIGRQFINLALLWLLKGA